MDNTVTKIDSGFDQNNNPLIGTMPPQYWDKEKMAFFDPSNVAEIHTLSKGMNEAECLLYFGITNTAQISHYDYFFFHVEFCRGRVQGKQAAVEYLFDNMRMKGGFQASISYLTRFGDEWEVNETDKPGSRTMRIVMAEE